MPEKLTLEQVSESIEKIGYKLVGEYKRNNKPVLIQSPEGYFAMARLDNIKSGQLPRIIDRSNPYTINNIKLWIKLNNKEFELLSNEYKDANAYLEFQCLNKKCGEKFVASWDSILHHHGCPYCVGQKVCESNCLATLRPDIAKDWDYDKNEGLTPYDVTSNSTKYIDWKCYECGYKWKTDVNYRNKCGCPQCNESKGEKKVSLYLTDNKIKFIRQYKFKDCKNKRALPFDFAIFNNNDLVCLIEYDGRQHFEICEYFGGEKAFRYLQLCDEIKNNYCKLHNIKLIRISYWEFDNIEVILNKELDIVKLQCVS